MVILALLLIFTSCDKEEDADVTPQLPVKTDPPVAPIARAGNDTTIYTPFSTCVFNGSASTDPDNNIVSYEWKFLAGPSSALLQSLDQSNALVQGLKELGSYVFELTVRDADNLSSKDTVMVTVASPPCITPNKEVIIKDQIWSWDWENSMMQIDILSYLPSKSYLRNVYIKRDSSDDWELVDPLVDYDHDMPRSPKWVYYGNLNIYLSPNTVDDSPDVKIEYCE